MASSSRQSGANKWIQTPAMTLNGHEPVARTSPGSEKYMSRSVSSICYFPDGKQMISGSEDKTARRWDLRAGKEIEGVRDVCEDVVSAVGVSRDGRWVVTAVGDANSGKLKVCEVETWIVRTFQGHSGSAWRIDYIDISADSTLLASGSYFDDIAQIWSLATGRLVAGAFGSLDKVGAVRFSQDSKKLAVISNLAKWLEVWDVKTQTLDVRVGQGCNGLLSHPPVFWTAKDKTIVAVFNFKDDKVGKPNIGDIKTIYEFDASTLEIVGTPFEGRTSMIDGLALSFDCALLASASWYDGTIKLWDFESRQLLTSFDIQYFYRLIFSPNSHQLAYTTSVATSIFVCDIPPDIIATAQEVLPNISGSGHPNLLNSNATRRAVRRKPVISPVTFFAPRPLRHSTIHSQRPTFFRHLRKLLPFRTKAVQNDQPRDPLDFPATSPPPRHCSPSTQETTKTRSRMNLHENSRPHIIASTTFTARLHGLWPVRAGHALSPIVDVPLAQGKERNAAAGAPPKNSEGWIPDEDYVPSRPPSPDPNSPPPPPPPPAVQTNTGEHGSGRLCGCF